MPLKKFRLFLLACMICVLCAVQASALEYSYDGADDFLFAQPTSDDTIYEVENPNVDRSKNVALVAPGFGTPTSYLPGSGEALTPNLVPGALSGGLVNQVGSANYSVSENGVSSGMGGFLPSTSILDSGSSGNTTPPEHFSVTTRPNDTASVGFTSVTEDSYYSNGSLGTLKIPAIGLSVKIVQGTDSASLAKGVGHFEETSIWNGKLDNSNNPLPGAVFNILKDGQIIGTEATRLCHGRTQQKRGNWPQRRHPNGHRDQYSEGRAHCRKV